MRNKLKKVFPILAITLVMLSVSIFISPIMDVTFQIVPDLDAEAGFGVIQTFAVDDASGWLYFAWWSQAQNSTDNTSRHPALYRCTTEAGSLHHLEFESDKDHGPSGVGYVNSLTIHDGRMFFVEQTWSQEKQTDICLLRFGTIDRNTGA